MQAEKENIKDIHIQDEMKGSYMSYAMSVIIARALPDARDGLKPSQRRIMAAMNDLSLGPRSKYRKCAKICGDTSGNYHPHGEQVIYPTMVRLAQDFNTRYRLVDGQGNFGSIDGDPPAAMRYTEARMTSVATDMLEDINRDTIDFARNYDDTRDEPTVLPGKFPNLLANGSSGIAVGMATSIPPHNIVELCHGITHLIDNPEATVDELIEFVKGPDFPTGATIRGTKGIQDAYHGGRGIVTVEAKSHIEKSKGGKSSIVVTEIPYQVSKTRIIDKMVELVKQGKVPGISDIRDESDREGLRLVIEIKRGGEEAVIRNQLYKFSPLRDSFSIIMIALVSNRPVVLNLKEAMSHYVEHRFIVIRRRTQYMLDRALERAHILEGLLIALKNIDKVIETIKKSKSVDDARVKLMRRFKLSEVQAQAILDMRLQRLTGLERAKVKEEHAELQKKIAGYNRILKTDKLVFKMIKEDLVEIERRFGDDRRTEIAASEARDFTAEELISEEDVVVVISHEGYIKRMPMTSYRKQHRGGKGVTGADPKEGDFIERLFIASTHDYICFFTDRGQLHWLKVYDVPQLSRQSRGRAIVNLLSLNAGEKICSTIPARTFDDDRYLVIATEKGIIKKTVLSAYGKPKKGGIIAINLDKGDSVIAAAVTNGSNEIMLGTRNGQSIRFAEADARRMGRATRGVKGIKLAKGDSVVAMIVIDRLSTVLTVCERGFGKRTTFDAYRRQRRGGKGLINIKTSARNGKVVGMLSVRDDDELMLMTQKGMVVRTSVSEIRTIGRATQGVTVIKMKNAGDKLTTICEVAKEAKSKDDGDEPVDLTDVPEQVDAEDEVLAGKPEAQAEDSEAEAIELGEDDIVLEEPEPAKKPAKKSGKKAAAKTAPTKPGPTARAKKPPKKKRKK